MINAWKRRHLLPHLLPVTGNFQDVVYKGLSTTPFNNFFVLQTDAPEDIQPISWKKQIPFRFETVFLLWACCRPLEWTGSVCDWLSHCEYYSFKNGLRRTRQNKMGFFTDSFGPPAVALYRPHLVPKIFLRLRCAHTLCSVKLIWLFSLCC